jgi:hypothetical protein
MFPQSFTKNSNLPYYSYEDRGLLRTFSPQNGTQVLVDGLGMFIYTVGSDQPDDDESCFVAQGGSWILQYVTWDLVNNWQLPDAEFNNSITSRFYFGSGFCDLTSVSNTQKVSFSMPVIGAVPGAQVVVSPTYLFQTTTTGGVGFYGIVETAGSVTVYLFNPSASNQTIVTGTWVVAVINN